MIELTVKISVAILPVAGNYAGLLTIPNKSCITMAVQTTFMHR
ncbi:MAG: hypothetical protein U1E98_03740 [Moraxella osloensis]